MFELRLRDRDRLLTIAPATEDKPISIQLFKAGRKRKPWEAHYKPALDVEFSLTTAEFSLVIRAFEVIRRRLVARSTGDEVRALEVGSVDDGRLRMFIPDRNPITEDRVAVIWVTNPSGDQSAVFLDASDVSAVGSWATRASRYLSQTGEGA